MSLYVKSLGCIFFTVIICVVLAKQGKEISLLLTIASCAMVASVAVLLLEPVTNLILKLETLGNLNSGMVMIILKTIGVGLLSQISSGICADAGNATLGKVLQFLTCAVLLGLSTPLLQELISIVEMVLGNL